MPKRKNNRRIGHNYERRIVKDFKALGYNNCGTTRNFAKKLDDCKVDIANVPFNIQVKRLLSKPVKYWEIFKEMTSLLKKHYPDRVDLPRIIIHKRGFKKEEELVIMPLADFYKLLKNNK